MITLLALMFSMETFSVDYLDAVEACSEHIDPTGFEGCVESYLFDY